MTMSMTASKVSIVIVDDDDNFIRSLEESLIQDKRISISATFTDPVAALTQIISLKPDLIIVDIQMPEINGFELVRQLNDLDIRPYIIFVTAFDEYAIEALRLSAFDYLLKPVEPSDLVKTMERFFCSFQKKAFENSYHDLLSYLNVKKIRFNNAGGFIMINPQHIIYVEADWNYSEINLGDGKKELVTMNLGMVEKMLPVGWFARISRSVIVNLRYLEKVNRGKRQCILKKGDEVFSFSIPLRRIRELEEII